MRGSADKDFEEIRAQLLRASAVGEEVPATGLPVRRKHLYELDIDEAPEAQLSPRRADQKDIIAEMLGDLQDDIDALRRETDAAVRRARLQVLQNKQ